MKRRFALVYAWIVRSVLFFLPDFPIFMRFRGWLYGFSMSSRGRNFQVAHSAVLVCLDSISVGRDVYVANNTVLLGGGGIVLEDEVMIAHNVVISSNNHTPRDGSYRWGARTLGRVHVGRGAWVAANCTIVANSTLASGCVLAAGSVLSSSVKSPGVILGGVPARVIRG